MISTFLFSIYLAVAGFFGIQVNQPANIGAGTVARVFQGGTGTTSFAVGQCLKGNGTSSIVTGDCSAGGGIALTDLSNTATGLTYSSTTGVTSLTSGYEIPLTASTSNWETSYTNYVSTWTPPLQYSAGTASITQSASTSDGYLSSTDWNTFNEKADASAVSSFITMYYWNGSSNISGYEMLRTIPHGGVEVSEATTTITNTKVLLDTYVSTSTAPASDGGLSFTSIPAGTWNFHTWAQTSTAAGTNVLVFDVYRRLASGTELYLFSATSSELVTAVTEVSASATYTGTTTSPGGTDRLVVKTYAFANANGRTITWYYDGISRASHIETTLSTVSSGFTRSFADETITGAWSFATITVSKAFKDSTNASGTAGQILMANGTSTIWTATSSNSLSLMPLVGKNTITTLGTVTTGTWNAGALTSSGALTVNGTGNSYFAGAIGVGSSTFTTNYKTAIIGMASSSPTTVEIILQNRSATASSSADLTLGNDKMTNTAYFLNAGMNSSGFSQPGYWTINGANDSYLYSNGGHLSIGTASSSKYLSFFTGGTLAANERMRIDSTGSTSIGTTTPAINALLTVFGQLWATVVKATTQLFIPSSATLLTQTAGETGIDTTKSSGYSQFRFNDGTATNTLTAVLTPSFTIASTSLTGGAATTTIPMGYAGYNETWSSAICGSVGGTGVGTTTLRFGDGTNWTNVITATSTAYDINLSSNNSFVLAESRQVQIMTTAGSPNYINCTIHKTVDAD